MAYRFSFLPGRGYVPLGVMPKREARALWDELRGKTSKGEKIPPRGVRFGPRAEVWFERKQARLTTSTRKGHRAALDNEWLPRYAHRKVAEITVDEITRDIRRMEEHGLSSSTISNYLIPLKGTFALACRDGLLSVNPCDLLTEDDLPETRKRRTAYEWMDEEIDALLEASEVIARQLESRQDYSLALRLAVDTGLRKGELLGAKWQDIDFEEGVLHVRRQWTKYGELTPPKTPKALRRVPLAPHVVAYLRRHRLASKHSRDEDFIFTSRTGTPLGHRNVDRRGFEAARDLAELPTSVRFHDLRHAFASRAAHRGVPLNVLSEIMGHTNVAVTAKVYVHLYGRGQAEDAFRAAMAQ